MTSAFITPLVATAFSFAADELLDILTKGDGQKVKESSNDFIFNFTSLSQGFIDDVFRDSEIYKMWYKWKNS